MSKKNIRNNFRKDNGYPLPKRTVLYSHKKHLEPVPEVGKRYHCFDDGKITFSRHYIIKVDEVLNYMEFKRKYPEQFEKYCYENKQHYWLFSRSSDKFIITYKGENDEFGVFTRTKQGGWFGISGFWNNGLLDVSGKTWEGLVSDIDMFDYTDEEKEQILKENAL